MEAVDAELDASAELDAAEVASAELISGVDLSSAELANNKRLAGGSAHRAQRQRMDVDGAELGDSARGAQRGC